MIRHSHANSITSRLLSVFVALAAAGVSEAMALELDWSGQFRAEYNYIHNYSLGNTENADLAAGGQYLSGGYFAPSSGKTDATFQTLFLKLRPKLVVNDNVYVKSEWWLGDPVFGVFGNAVPFSGDQRNFYSNQSRGSAITAQRLWAEFLSDIGTVQVGRAPLHWGLGVVWNSGEGFWDRYHSTGDTVRIISKFGAFSVIPSFIVYSTGNSVGGGGTYNSATGLLTNTSGSGGVTEYTLALKYENLDEDLEGGVNFIRRLGGAAQDPNGGILGPFDTTTSAAGTTFSSSSMNYNIWDIYARKRLGRFTLGVEAPIVSGKLGTPTGQGVEYSTFAVAAEADWKISDSWGLQLKGGHAPGQPSQGSATPSEFKAFYFNPAYRLGNIMFNYQLANFVGPNTQNNPGTSSQAVRSPYDNPIVNANYLMANGLLHTDKWTFNLGLVWAQADQTAGNAVFYNHQRRQQFATVGGGQSSSLGFETDLGAAFQWDEAFQFRADFGVYFPGDFFKYTNVAGRENPTSTVYSGSARVGISF